MRTPSRKPAWRPRRLRASVRSFVGSRWRPVLGRWLATPSLRRTRGAGPAPISLFLLRWRRWAPGGHRPPLLRPAILMLRIALGRNAADLRGGRADGAGSGREESPGRALPLSAPAAWPSVPGLHLLSAVRGPGGGSRGVPEPAGGGLWRRHAPRGRMGTGAVAGSDVRPETARGGSAARAGREARRAPGAPGGGALRTPPEAPGGRGTSLPRNRTDGAAHGALPRTDRGSLLHPAAVTSPFPSATRRPDTWRTTRSEAAPGASYPPLGRAAARRPGPSGTGGRSVRGRLPDPESGGVGGRLVHARPAGPGEAAGAEAAIDAETGRPVAPSPVPAPPPSGLDMSTLDLGRITDEVYRKLENRLRVEKERRGL